MYITIENVRLNPEIFARLKAIFKYWPFLANMIFAIHNT